MKATALTRHFLYMTIWAALLPGAALAGSAPSVETIVLVRHGEKPKAGLGQLDCRGLNRALALGGVVRQKFGRPPDALFAPDPSSQKSDHGIAYDYVRPLATIEPTAIAFGLPVNARIGLNDLDALKTALADAKLRDALVLVAWEHLDLAPLARQLLAEHGGQRSDPPDWDGNDFDSIYVVRITRDGAHETAAFEHAHEGLDGEPDICPGPAPR